MSGRVDVLTAFTVAVDMEGNAWAMADTYPEAFSCFKQADLRSIKKACSQLVEDIRSEEIAVRTAELLKPAESDTYSSADRIEARLRERLAEREASDG